MVFIDRHEDSPIGDGEVHMACRDRRAILAEIRPGDGMVVTSSPASRSVASISSSTSLFGSSVTGRHLAERMSRPDKAGDIVDMAVGVVVQQAIAQPDHFVDAERRRRCSASISSAVRSGLRFGLSRHWRVVSRRPLPSASMAPPSRTISCEVAGRDSSCSDGACRFRIAGHQVFAAPSIEAEGLRRTRHGPAPSRWGRYRAARCPRPAASTTFATSPTAAVAEAKASADPAATRTGRWPAAARMKPAICSAGLQDCRPIRRQDAASRTRGQPAAPIRAEGRVSCHSSRAPCHTYHQRKRAAPHGAALPDFNSVQAVRLRTCTSHRSGPATATG
jgi:hypothetical protein